MEFPMIDTIETGKNIQKLRKQCGMTVRDIQNVFGFTSPQAIYKWQMGKSLPTVDNLIVLAMLFHTTMDQIIITKTA